MPEITLLALDFARYKFREVISDLLDDPSDLLDPARMMEPGAEIAAYRKVGGDLGLDFDELVSRGTEFERRRLSDLEALTDPQKTAAYLKNQGRAPAVKVADPEKLTKTVPPRAGWPYRPLSSKPPVTIPHSDWERRRRDEKTHRNGS